jgi:hypothetical protein
MPTVKRSEIGPSAPVARVLIAKVHHLKGDLSTASATLKNRSPVIPTLQTARFGTKERGRSGARFSPPDRSGLKVEPKRRALHMNRQQRRALHPVSLHAKTTATSTSKFRRTPHRLDPVEETLRGVDADLGRCRLPADVALYANEEAALRILNDPEGREPWEAHAHFRDSDTLPGLWMMIEAALESMIWRMTRRAYRFSERASDQLQSSDLHEVPGQALSLLPSPVLSLVIRRCVYLVVVRPPWVQIVRVIGPDALPSEEGAVRMDLALTDDNIDRTCTLEVNHFGEPVPTRPSTNELKEVLAHLLFMCTRREPVRRKVVSGRAAGRLDLYVREVGEPEGIPTTRFNPPTSRPCSVRVVGPSERSVRPHFRRGHFAHRWHGSERLGTRRREVHWIQPTRVGGGTLPDLVISEVGPGPGLRP